MRKLNKFQKFDFAAWQAGKKFVIQGVKWNERKECVSLDVVIIEDNTDYGDKNISNIYEKFKVNCIENINKSDVDQYSIGKEIIFKKVGRCSVYGDYNSNLSIEAVVEQNE